MKICIFGDSIAHGFHEYGQGSWAARLERFLNEGEECEIYNYAVPGDDSNDLLKILEASLIDKELDLIIFAIGINDSSYIKANKDNRVSVVDFKNNLARLKEYSEKYTKKVIFIGLTKVDESKVGSKASIYAEYLGNSSIQKYDLVIQEFCKENKLLYIPMFDTLEDKDMNDGLHPDDQGHEKMFVRVRDFLLENKIFHK